MYCKADFKSIAKCKKWLCTAVFALLFEIARRAAKPVLQSRCKALSVPPQSTPKKHKNRPKIGRFSHFNPSAEMHPFSLFSASKAPEKWLYDAICRKKQLFAGSFGSRSHSSCSFTPLNTAPCRNNGKSPALSRFWESAGLSLSKKLRFCAKLPTNRACGPVRRARRGVILNEKRGSTPFGGIRRVACTLLRKDAWLCHRQLFPRTLLLLLCLFRRSVWARAFIFSAAAFHAPHSLATRASPLCQRRVRIYQR